VDKSTGASKHIPLNGFHWLNDLDWARASNLILVVTQLENYRSAIWTVRPDGSQWQKVIESEESIASAHWSASGDAIYFIRSKGVTPELTKVLIDTKSGQAEGTPVVLWSGFEVGGFFTLSSDGARLLYTRTQSYSNLWLAEFPATEKDKKPKIKPLTRGTSMMSNPSISPDGKWIAYTDSSQNSNIYKMTIDGGPATQLTFSNAFKASPSWSPDGKRIAFCSNEGGSIKVWTIESDGSSPQPINGTRLSPSYILTWSPGRKILYQEPTNRNFKILDPETGEEESLIKDDSVGWIFSPKYSPDGKRIAVWWNRSDNRMDRGLWVISLSDKSATLIVRGNMTPSGWSPDGASIYVVSPSSDTITSIPAEGGDPQSLFTLPGSITYASVSPNGRRFVCSVAETKSDVWLMLNFDPDQN
jgi:Tol biopolymer transport system component